LTVTEGELRTRSQLHCTPYTRESSESLNDAFDEAMHTTRANEILSQVARIFYMENKPL